MVLVLAGGRKLYWSADLRELNQVILGEYEEDLSSVLG